MRLIESITGRRLQTMAYNKRIRRKTLLVYNTRSEYPFSTDDLDRIPKIQFSGYGVRVKVDNMRPKSELVIADGRQDFKDGASYRFRPRKIPYDSIVIDGHSGYISLQAFHWLSKNKIPVFILNFDGSLISSILPPIPIKADLRAAQLDASRDPDKKFKIAHELVKAKIQRSNDVLKWLAERYDIEDKVRRVKKESVGVSEARTIKDLRIVEGRVALRYWQTIQSVIPETFDFQGRITKKHQYNASDPVNLTLNYTYGVLEGECRRAINTVGLEPSIGFLHDFSDYQTKQSLVYDLQEPYRWLADMTVIEALESGLLDMKDFYFMGDDYRYHFDVEAKRRLLYFLKDRFNSGVLYKGKTWQWNTVILNKVQELGRFLLGKNGSFDFTQPVPSLRRSDNLEIRDRILQLTQRQAEKVGIGRSTLHYLRKHSRNDKQFKITRRIAKRLR
jgi:CRISPR-associated protein Cas1